MSDIETGPDRFVICHIAINGQHAHDALDSIENELTAARERIAEWEGYEEWFDDFNAMDPGRTLVMYVELSQEHLKRIAELEAERDSLRKLAGELVGALKDCRGVLNDCADDTMGTPSKQFFDSKVGLCDIAIESAQNAGIANPSA